MRSAGPFTAGCWRVMEAPTPVSATAAPRDYQPGRFSNGYVCTRVFDGITPGPRICACGSGRLFDPQGVGLRAWLLMTQSSGENLRTGVVYVSAEWGCTLMCSRNGFRRLTTPGPPGHPFLAGTRAAYKGGAHFKFSFWPRPKNPGPPRLVG